MSGLNLPLDLEPPADMPPLAGADGPAGGVAGAAAKPKEERIREPRRAAKKRNREQDRWMQLADECSAALAFIEGAERARLGITSCLRGEGRTTVAAATALAQCLDFGLETILVELDLENPSLAGLLGLEPRSGVAEVLRGEAHLDACIQWTRSDLGVLVAGAVRSNPSKLVSALMTSSLMDDLQHRCQVMVADLPPFSGPGARVAGLCSSVLLVVRAGATSLDHVRRAAAELDHPPVMLNRVTSSLPRWMNGMLGSAR